MAIKKIKKTTVVEQVMEQIKTLIATGAYKPGDKIPTELELSESFGVGRSSIREAIKIFNYMGVLRSQAAKGTFVEERSNISSESLTWSLLLGEDELNEMIDLRCSIEIWAMFKLVDEISSKSSGGILVIEDLKLIIENIWEKEPITAKIFPREESLMEFCIFSKIRKKLSQKEKSSRKERQNSAGTNQRRG